MNFADFGLCEPVLRAVVSAGYTTPTPIQAQAIPHVLAGADLLGCAQTGTGKTAAFALPMLHRLHEAGPVNGRKRPTRVLALSPTRELAGQIADSFRDYGCYTGLRHTAIFGGVNQRPQVRDLQRGVDILIATPGRLCDLMGQGYVDLSQISTFVLDEADRMLDMGFLPDLRRIIAKLPTERQTLFFSATMPAPIEQLANSVLRDPAQVRIAPVRATTELIEQSVYFVSQKQKPDLLAHCLTQRAISRAIVFTRTKHGADRVTKQLTRVGVRADAIHGNKSQAARQRVLGDFKAHRTHVLVATDVAARGLDIDGVSHVFNYDLPHEAETYVHRIGRTGRAGASGVAVSFCDGSERRLLRAIERLTRQTIRAEKEMPRGKLPVIAEPPVAEITPPARPAGNKPRPPFGENKPRRAKKPAAQGTRRFDGSRPPANGAKRPFKKRRRPSGSTR